MNRTGIEWCSYTWNPVTGCTPVSPACEHCWAKRMARRLAGRAGYPADEPFRVTLHPERLEEPLRVREPQRIFVVSMGDLLHDAVPDEFIAAVFGVMLFARHHTFQVLTKRAERLRDWSASASVAICAAAHYQFRGERDLADAIRRRATIDDWGPWPLPNVWLGVTAENQREADYRIPLLLRTPAAVRFVSIEPMLGPIDLWGINGHPLGCEGLFGCEPKLDWLILGGETGPGARPMQPDWVRSLRHDCAAVRVPFFFKRMGSAWPGDQLPDEFKVRQFPEAGA